MKLGVIGRYSSEFLKMAKEIGYGYVEISARDFIKEEVPDPGAMAEEVRKELEELGLSLSCFGAYDNFLRATEEEFEGEVEKIRLTLELAEILGAPVIRVYGGRFKEEVPKERWKDLMVEGFKRTLEYAEPQGIKLALDNHGRTTNDAEFEVVSAGSATASRRSSAFSKCWCPTPCIPILKMAMAARARCVTTQPRPWEKAR